MLRKLNHKQTCNLNRARKYINNKRKATWGWQSKLSMPQTPTRYNERHIHGCGYLKWSGKRWAKLAHKHYMKLVQLNRNPKAAICYVFRRYCGQALNVSWCESKYDVTAGVGKHQYLGLFQMGDFARTKYGHGWTALEQVVAAHKYFVDSGRDWSPWSCSAYG